VRTNTKTFPLTRTHTHTPPRKTVVLPVHNFSSFSHNLHRSPPHYSCSVGLPSPLKMTYSRVDVVFPTTKKTTTLLLLLLGLILLLSSAMAAEDGNQPQQQAVAAVVGKNGKLLSPEQAERRARRLERRARRLERRATKNSSSSAPGESYLRRSTQLDSRMIRYVNRRTENICPVPETADYYDEEGHATGRCYSLDDYGMTNNQLFAPITGSVNSFMITCNTENLKLRAYSGVACTGTDLGLHDGFCFTSDYFDPITQYFCCEGNCDGAFK